MAATAGAAQARAHRMTAAIRDAFMASSPEVRAYDLLGSVPLRTRRQGVAGPQATLEALRFAMSGNAYVVRDFGVEPLGKESTLVRASISYPERDVTVVTSVESLVTGRDGLIWRSRIVASGAEAERILRDEGPELGL